MTNSLKNIGRILLALSLLLSAALPANAKLVFTNDVFQNEASIFRIGQGYDASTNDLQLQFGTTNTKTFMWDYANTRFDLSNMTAVPDILTKAQGDLRLGDADTSNYVALQAAGTVNSNVTWTLPATDGSNGQFLATNGSGTLSWANAAGGGATLQTAYDNGATITTASSTPIAFTLSSGGFNVTGAGATSIGNNAGTVAVDSTSWDISTAGVASGLTGITSTGTLNFSGASRFAMTQFAGTPGTCTVGDMVYNTLNNKVYTCTATNTWSIVGPADFENVYAYDADKTLTTSNGAFTLAAGSGAVQVNSTNAAGVTINGSVNGPVNIGTGTSTGTVTIGGTGAQTLDIGNGAGAKIVNLGSTNTTSTTNLSSGAGGLNLNTSAVANTTNLGTGAANKTVNLGSTNTTSTTNINSGSGGVNVNVSNDGQTTNIGTGTTTGQINIGGGSNCVKVDSNTWDISCAGGITGVTGLTLTGNIDFTTATTFKIPQYASDPGTCTAGEQYYNTTTNTVRLCVAGNTWTGAGPSGTQYVFAIDTTTQTVAVPNTFQDVTFDTNVQIDGWTHVAGTATFTPSVGGTFMANMTARVAKNGGANTTISLRMTKNGNEISGSQSYGTCAGSSGDTMSGNFIFTVTAGDVIKIQMTGGTVNTQILPGGDGTTKPSIQFNVWRMK